MLKTTLMDPVDEFKKAALAGLSLPGSHPESTRLRNKFLTAARTGDVRVLKQVAAAYPSDINIKLGQTTALHAAAIRKQAHAVTALLQAGASPNVMDNDRASSALHEVVQNNDTHLLVQMIHKGANVNLDGIHGTPAMQAIETNANKTLAVLLTHGASAMKFDDDGHTLLHRAARLDRAESLVLLLSKGLDINALARDGKTPLMVAAEYGSLEAAKVLLDSGADYRVMDDMRDTAFDIAGTNGDTAEKFQRLIRLRIAQDAEVAARPFNDGAEQHIAIRRPLKIRKA